ncbi:pentatricopeptide repeat-containing protein At5g14080 [Aristolochia californica]|uniref:pentatricopeptide repeat-containing protein At5g14080 n=1 Tax=Aristolochia californica TaxID=171875 RepID=UPI0035DD9916
MVPIMIGMCYCSLDPKRLLMIASGARHYLLLHASLGARHIYSRRKILGIQKKFSHNLSQPLKTCPQLKNIQTVFSASHICAATIILRPAFQSFPITTRPLLSLDMRSLSSHSYDHLKAHKSTLTSIQFSSGITSHLAEKKPIEAYHLFDQMTKSTANIDFDPNICNSLLATLSTGGHSQFSHAVFDAMLFRKISFNTIGFGVFINQFCRVSKVDKVMCLLDRIEERIKEINGSVVAVMVVKGLCHASRVMDSWQVLEELRRRNCKPDFIAYQVVVEAFRALGRAEEARNVLRQKRKLGVAPRMNDYKEFIISLISERQVEEAKELGEIIISNDFPIDDDALNALIGPLSGVYTDSAILFCKYMIGKDRFPTSSTLYTLCRNLVQSGKTDEMWDIIHILSSKDYFSDLQSYSTMISVLCEAGSVREAYGVLKEMKKKGLGPDIFSYNCLMEALCREDLVRPAKKLWDEMFKSGFCGNLQTYNVLIKKLSKVGEVEEAQHLFYHMLEKGILPDSITYTTLLRGLCREAKIDEACEIVLKSRKQDTELFKSSLNVFVISLCKEGKFSVALKVMQGLSSSDIDDSNSHVTLLKSLAESGEINVGINHIKWVRINQPWKLQRITNKLVQSLSFSLKMEPTLRLLHAMHQIGIAFENDSWINLYKDIQA